MKAIQITHQQELNVIEIEKPSAPGQGEVLLRLHYVGFCGSDINTFMGRNTMALNPVIPGHEVGAVIEAVGEGVPEGLKPGMVVTCNPYTNCGKCASGTTVNVDANIMKWVDQTKEFTDKGYNNKTSLWAPEWAADQGPEGKVFGFFYSTWGINFTLAGNSLETPEAEGGKLELARQMGASYTINTRTEDVHARLMEMTGGFGPDVVIEAVGSTPTYQMAVDEVAFTGRVVCIGYAKAEVSFQTKYFVQKELDIRGSRNAMPQDFRAVIHYLERRTCPVDKLITKEIHPEQALDTMRWWSQNPGKVFRILMQF